MACGAVAHYTLLLTRGDIWCHGVTRPPHRLQYLATQHDDITELEAAFVQEKRRTGKVRGASGASGRARA
jgi:hypothetical protein